MTNFLGAIEPAAIVLIVIGAIIGAFAVAILIFRSCVEASARRLRYRSVEIETDGKELCEANLARAGLSEITVKKGLTNHYSFRRKRITLSRRVYNKKTMLGVAIIMQLVALAIIKNQDETARKKARLAEFFNFSASAIFIFMIVIGSVIGFAGAKSNPVVAIVLYAVGLVIYIISTIVSIKQGSLVNRANKDAMVYIENMGLFTDEEIKKITKYYKLKVTEYKLDTVLSVIYLIYFTIKLILSIFKIAGMFAKK